MSHFLPSRVKTGCLTADAAAAVGFGADDCAAGALKGAGPERNAVFLCVCISAVTRFKPRNDTDMLEPLINLILYYQNSLLVISSP